MPDIVHETTTADFSDLQEYCSRKSIQFERLMEVLKRDICLAPHVKHVEIEGAVATIHWGYPLPRTHVARRELEVEKAVASALAILLES